MKKKALKLLLSSTAAACAALSLSASTFAYVLISNNVYVQDFSFEIEGQEGLNISLDGNNWSQDITTDQLKAKIEESAGVSFDTIRLNGVTMNQVKSATDSNYYVTYGTDGRINFEKDKVSSSYNTTEFVYEEETYKYIKDNNGTLVYDSTSQTYVDADATQLADATTQKYSLYINTNQDLYILDSDNKYVLTTDTTVIWDTNIQKYALVPNAEYGHKTYTHSMEGATINRDYLAFDLWFKAMSTGGKALNTLKLTFGENTNIKVVEKAGDSLETYKNITLQNAFKTKYYQNGSYVEVQHASGDVIKQDVSNAMRLGVYNKEEDDNLQIYEVTNDADLGSVALTGSIEKEHDPYNSIMINYYNVIHPLYPFLDADGNPYGATYGEAYETVNAYGSYNAANEWEGNSLGTFATDGTLKVTIYIWLEGWDADYLLGTTEDASKLNANLEFVLANV